MKQIITLNFGQAGINISNQTLSLYLREHAIKPSPSAALSSSTLIDAKYNRVFFEEAQSGALTHRAISVDCDPYSTNELLAGSNKDHYKKSLMVSSKSSSGGFYSRGYSISKRELCEQLEETLQKTVEGCDNLQGVMVNGALLGGTAGAMHQILGKVVGEEYLRKKTVVTNVLFPSEGYSNSIVEIYNYCFAFRTLLEYSNLNIPYDNQSLYRACEEAGIEAPGYSEINQLIAAVQSSLTLPFRCLDSSTNQLNQMTTNLVCYPRINLTYPSSTPLLAPDRLYHNRFRPMQQVTAEIFNPSTRLINMHGVEGKIAVGLYYRGDVNHYEVTQSLNTLRESKSPFFRFQDWSPLGVKVGISPHRPLPHYYCSANTLHYPPDRSCVALTSAMEFNKLLGFNNLKFDRLYANRAYVYTFIQENMQEGEFSEAREDLAALEKDYETWECYEIEEEED